MDKVLKEEIEKSSEELGVNKQKLKNVLNELFTFDSSMLLRRLGSQEEILDEKDALPEEFWQLIIENINASYEEDPKVWEEEFSKIKYQIICNKYFTKNDLIELSEIEKNLKIDIKKYFSSLQNSVSNENFRERFFNLPFDILTSFVRFILNNSKELNKKLQTSKDDIKEKIEELKKERLKMIKKIAFVSNGNNTILDLKKLKDLVEYGVFNEDNLLNRGVNEYLYKLLNHPQAVDNITETFNAVFVSDLLKCVENSSAYINHIQSVKNDESPEFFTPGGQQIGRRFDNQIEKVEQKDYDDSVIDKKSIFKEPKGEIKATVFSWDDNSGEPSDSTEGGDVSGGGGFGGGGGFSGGGDFSLGGDSDVGVPGGEETVDLPDDTAPDGSAPVDGTPMPTGGDGMPTDFGTEESNSTDNTQDTSSQEDKENK